MARLHYLIKVKNKLNKIEEEQNKLSKSNSFVQYDKNHLKIEKTENDHKEEINKNKHLKKKSVKNWI